MTKFYLSCYSILQYFNLGFYLTDLHLSVANIVQEVLATNKCVDIIYLDFKKAFNSVSHSKLLSKLWYLGIRGNLWNWFRAYLGSGRQCACINESLSSMVPVLSGVPQGNILGPLLFAVFD